MYLPIWFELEFIPGAPTMVCKEDDDCTLGIPDVLTDGGIPCDVEGIEILRLYGWFWADESPLWLLGGPCIELGGIPTKTSINHSAL